jgi:hypothetical protein
MFGFEKFTVSKKVQILNNAKKKEKENEKAKKKKKHVSAQTPRLVCGVWSAPTRVVYRRPPRALPEGSPCGTQGKLAAGPAPKLADDDAQPSSLHASMLVLV